MYKPGVTLIVALLSVAMSYAQGRDSVPDRLVVQHRIARDNGAADREFATRGVKVDRQIPSLRISVLRVPEQNIERVTRQLHATGLFTFVERDYVARGILAPNDPSFPSQWHLQRVQAPAAWDITRAVAVAPTIAMIDSGIDGSHSDLGPALVPGWNFLNGTSVTSDVLGHGTATAGVAGAVTDNALGISGLAWGASIMPLVVLNSSNYATYSNIAQAIVYAADRGVRIINISIAGTSASSTLQSAVDYAWNKGSVVFAGAGNSGSSTPNYPAACNNAIAVSASDQYDGIAGFSSRGSWIDVAAPGTSILTTTNGGGYGYWQGTSFSSPVAAAAGALVLAVRPNLSNTSLVALLQSNADDIGPAGVDTLFGYGRINAYRAVAAAASTAAGDTVPPTVAIATPAQNATVSGTLAVQGQASDNLGVTLVEFYVDGVLTASASSATFAFSWNTNAVPNGSHMLTVKAYDAAGNAGVTSIAVLVSNAAIADTVPPAVSIVNPVNGARISNQVKISVSAFDNVAVSQVAIYVDNVLVSTSTASSYTYMWNAKRTAAGAHTISARAWDAAGNMSTSATVTVYK